ncbi:tetratricopeptide repeat protein [Flavobacterium soli]|uniref:hypothetical protein n=1 Tax=Flavobacterium soli TaxID=344881 RepID=UPI00047D517D|nr:hypothetical protein [Flavobacterium soli]
MNKCLFLFFLFFKTNFYSQVTSQNDVDSLTTYYVHKADSLIRINDFKGAIVKYSEALNENADKLRIYKKRSIAYLADKDYENAILDYNKIIEIVKSSEKLANEYFYRGLCKIMLNKPGDDTCEDLMKAKEHGFEAEWSSFSIFCSNIAN